MSTITVITEKCSFIELLRHEGVFVVKHSLIFWSGSVVDALFARPPVQTSYKSRCRVHLKSCSAVPANQPRVERGTRKLRSG